MRRFSDGATLDTSGELRTIRKSDGLYVVGQGLCIPVRDAEDARQTLDQLRARKAKSPTLGQG